MLLAKLLRTLSEEETAKVRTEFRLSERSRLLFDRIAASASAPPNSSELAKAFRITTENLYRHFSEIVDECVRILAPKKEFATIKFYRSKYLYRPFITEAQRTEKQLLFQKDRKQLERLYGYMFQSVKEFPIDLIDLDLLEEYGMKWHRIKEAPPTDDELYIKMKIIFVRIAALPARKKMNLEQMAVHARNLLDPVAAEASLSINPLARHEYYQSEWKACIFEKTEPHKVIQWLERSLELVKEHPSAFDPQRCEVLELQIAHQLATKCGKAKESLETYKKYYRGQTPETSRGALFLSRFSVIAFLARDFSTSRKILGVLIDNQIIKATPSIHLSAMIIKILIEIIEGNSEVAARTMEIAKTTNRENYFLAYEVQIRALEVVVALKQKDYSVADQLCERNIKWLRSRRIALSTSAWIYYYQMIVALIHNQLSGEPIRRSLLDHFNTDLQAEHPEFHILLEAEIAKASTIN